MRKLRAGLRSEVDPRARARRQFGMAGDEVGMQVSFNDVRDAQALLGRLFQVDFDVTLRIDDGGFAFRPDHIRSVRQAAEIKLFEVHGLLEIIPCGAGPWPARGPRSRCRRPHKNAYSPSSSCTMLCAPYSLRRASVIPAVCTATARLEVPSYTKSPTSDSMLPSNIRPTISALRLITGEPELPPMISLVVTKSSGVARFSLSRP